MARKTDIEGRAIEAALALATEQGWEKTSYADIAAKAGLKIAELYPIFSSKTAILAAFSRRIDEKVLAGTDPEDAEEPAHDRLLDVLLRRFEALRPQREAIAAIVKDLPRDPVTAACLARQATTSMRWMLRAAGLDDHGLKGMVRVRALAGIYALSLRVWLNDDSPDLGKTTASLDKNLSRLEGWTGGIGR